MLTFEEAQAILSAVGTDAPPTSERLAAARAFFVDAARTARDAGDRQALATMLEAIRLADRGIATVAEAEAAAAAELDALVADVPELAAETPDETPDETPADTPRLLTVGEAAARLGLTTASDTPPAEVTERPTQTLTILGDPSNEAGWSELAAAFHRASKTSARSGRNVVASFKTEYPVTLAGKASENTAILNDIFARGGEEAVIAAGGCCSLAEPIRDQPMLASLDRPIAAALPTLGATSGAVAFFPPVCLPVTGVGTWDCADDEAVDPEDADTWKQCTEVECAEEERYELSAIYRCLEIGNFSHRFSPERWGAYLHATAAAQARIGEQALFAQIAGSSHTATVVVANVGSLYANVLRGLITAWAQVRSAQRYEGRRAQAILPAWVRDAAHLDVLARAIRRGRDPQVEPLERAAASHGIDIVWSPDVAPLASATAFPATAPAVLYVDGGVFRLDGGELNLGTEIRDHDLNRQNKLAAFGESFERAVVRTCDAKALTIPVAVCDDVSCTDLPGPGSSEGNPLFFADVTPAPAP